MDAPSLSLARDDPSKDVRQQSIVSALETPRESQKLSEATEFSTNPYQLERHGRGESHHRGYPSKDNGHEKTPLAPDVVVKPQTVQDVSRRSFSNSANTTESPSFPTERGPPSRDTCVPPCRVPFRWTWRPSRRLSFRVRTAT
mmetsp:Transcript_21557/g.59864  ORF Transcript_21557/g.59864 Transcript_21557/m.59864 type:complete len:143 (-) Transcript_21557:50-478(-)